MSRRLDEELVTRGMASDLTEARRIIDSRIVLIEGAPGLKAATLVAGSSSLTLNRPRAFVSRGGFKLDGALRDFELGVTGLRCLDAGTGSGGFTDCLLKEGAASVLAVDVGYGQFDWSLRSDPRVTLLERTNVRSLTPEPGRFDLIVADLSFLSLTSMAATIRALGDPAALCVLLVKPQFEAQVDEVGPGGIVSDPATWERTIVSVVEALGRQGLGTQTVAPSRLKGATGNQEFFVKAVPDVAAVPGVVNRAMELLR